ncbi:MAG: O-antigen ligase family protein [Ramlibacter sp.]
MGPVAVYALLFLVIASPLMRGGNRNVALIVLEGAALVVLAALVARARQPVDARSLHRWLLAFLLLSPAWLAVVYLLPLPPALWAAAPGRAEYVDLLAGIGIAAGQWRPLSLAPDATSVSLLAGIPIVAAFAAAYVADLRQFRVFLGVLVVVAFAEVLMGMLQLAGGSDSSLYFGSAWIGGGTRPFGTFANSNHFANYIAMALAAYIFLGWLMLTERRRRGALSGHDHAATMRVAMLLAAGAVLLVVGILISRSRAAALSGLPAAMAALAVALAGLRGGRTHAPSRRVIWIVGGILLAGLALVGFDALVARFDLQRIAGDMPFRLLQAGSTLEGAWQLWPFGSGWGTYFEVYPRFQPPALVGTAHFAHQDYAQILFEGGLFGALLILAFAWLAITRAIELIRTAVRLRRLPREAMASAICGLGLLGFLVHSLAEFNMHIPANAIAAALLAGVYLRPLPVHDRRDGAADD